MITREQLAHRPDSSGECDRCHAESALWTDPDEPGEWSYCKECCLWFLKVKAKAKKMSY